MSVMTSELQPQGLLSPDVFAPELYALEMDRVFGRCWLFVGHESMIPKPHDFFTHFMGEVEHHCSAGRRARFASTSTNAGTAPTLFAHSTAELRAASPARTTVGPTRTGPLPESPHKKDAYRDEFDGTGWGLIEVPRVATIGGLIFGNWDKDAMSLDDYLGDAKWYLENFLCREDIGGLEVLPGPHRYVMPANWKFLAENFAGDHYHFGITHAGVAHALKQEGDSRIALTADAVKGKNYEFAVAAGYRKGPAHGFCKYRYGEGPYLLDLEHGAPARSGGGGVDHRAVAPA